jgi:hypothetical protein
MTFMWRVLSPAVPIEVWLLCRPLAGALLNPYMNVRE